jgi:hypothetical protein
MAARTLPLLLLALAGPARAQDGGAVGAILSNRTNGTLAVLQNATLCQMLWGNALDACESFAVFNQSACLEARMGGAKPRQHHEEADPHLAPSANRCGPWSADWEMECNHVERG